MAGGAACSAIAMPWTFLSRRKSKLCASAVTLMNSTMVAVSTHVRRTPEQCDAVDAIVRGVLEDGLADGFARAQQLIADLPSLVSLDYSNIKHFYF